MMKTKISYPISSNSVREHLEVGGRQSQRKLLGRQKRLGGQKGSHRKMSMSGH